MTPSPFKTCPLCSATWRGLDDFLADPAVHLNGYQINDIAIDKGFFLFSHTHADCGTTMSVPVSAFLSLTSQPFISGRRRPGQSCPGHCLRKDDTTSHCPQACECGWVRDIMRRIHHVGAEQSQALIR
ncbi:MAG: hypothetical protein RRC34_15860 [Lentisphaeria bacterium]|nr:hypothetical protein [Lentisphaeria bacterium]